MQGITECLARAGTLSVCDLTISGISLYQLGKLLFVSVPVLPLAPGPARFCQLNFGRKEHYAGKSKLKLNGCVCARECVCVMRKVGEAAAPLPHHVLGTYAVCGMN